jgi:hypothetical protein
LKAPVNLPLVRSESATLTTAKIEVTNFNRLAGQGVAGLSVSELL